MFSAVDSGRHRQLEVFVHAGDQSYRATALPKVLPSTALRNYPRESSLWSYGQEALDMPWHVKRMSLRTLMSWNGPIPLQAMPSRAISVEDTLRIEPERISLEITAPHFDQVWGTATRVALIPKRHYRKVQDHNP